MNEGVKGEALSRIIESLRGFSPKKAAGYSLGIAVEVATVALLAGAACLIMWAVEALLR